MLTFGTIDVLVHILSYDVKYTLHSTLPLSAGNVHSPIVSRANRLKNTSFQAIVLKLADILQRIGRSSNGRTTDSGSVNLGSSPSLPAILLLDTTHEHN